LNEERFLANPDREIRLIADLDGEPVGFGALVLAPPELRACYVVPEAARSGVGTALVREIERIAIQNGVKRLDLLSSLNAEPFYAALGYDSTEATNHVLQSGQVMAAVKMSKTLRGASPNV
jgi:putative acetyltransferase